MKIYYTGKFTSSYKKLPKSVKLVAEKKEKIFRKNPLDRVLKTHKLKGVLKGFWAFSIDRRYRIIFEFVSHSDVVFHNAGTHDIYRK